MTISHLQHDSTGIRCKGCGTRFEVMRNVLSDPEKLVDEKERIAGKHTCKLQPGRVVAPSSEELERYWKSAMSRLLPA